MAVRLKYKTNHKKSSSLRFGKAEAFRTGAGCGGCGHKSVTPGQKMQKGIIREDNPDA